MQKIKSAALALPALLLAGCAAALPAENTATIETAAAAAPQTLKVYTSASLAPAAQAYAEAQGVALTLTDEAASADLLLTDHALGGSLLDVTSDTLLAAAAARAGITENANALPLGRSLYGYWARADVLNALLGDGAAAALQTANCPTHAPAALRPPVSLPRRWTARPATRRRCWPPTAPTRRTR